MTKKPPLTLDQVTAKTMKILENDLAFQHNLTHLRDETDISPTRIRMPQVTYTPPPPKTPWLALAAFGLVALGVFIGVWLACAVAFLI